MSLAFRYAAHSDTGRVRGKNDDSAYVGRYLAVVADGMGGHVGGNVASASTVLDLTPLDHSGFNGSAGTYLADEIQTANKILNQLVELNPLLAGMGTTCTALLIDGDALELAHIGDSRAYRLHAGRMEQISTDHTFVQRLVDEGRITPEQAETHPHKNVVMRVLGDTDASPELQLEQVPAAVGDRFLLCSDGLSGVVDDRTIQAVLSSADDLQAACDDLVRLTLDRGAPDNVTVAIVEVIKEEELSRAVTSRIEQVPSPEKSSAATENVPDADKDHPFEPAAQIERDAADEDPFEDVEASSSADGAQEGDNSPADRRIAPWRRRIERPSSAPPLRHTLRVGKWRGDSFSDGVLNAMTERAGIDEASHSSEDPSSAAVLRRELAERPHTLVGAASSATQTGQIPTVTDSTVQRRATLVDAEPQDPEADDELPEEVLEQLEGPGRRRRRWGLTLFIWAFVLILVAGAAWASLAWVNSQYYVGENDGEVAIYQGVPQSIGPIHFSEMREETKLHVSDLSDFSRSRVQNTIHAPSYQEAEKIVDQLRENTSEDPSAEPSKSPSARPSGTVSTAGHPSAQAASEPRHGGGRR